MLKWKDIQIRSQEESSHPADMPNKIVRSQKEWQALLSKEAFQVTRLKGTERPFSSEQCNKFDPGVYECVCCQQILFDATEKFDSGSGWPAFTQAASDTAVGYHQDSSHSMDRVEVTCSQCDAHLGHVFPDGPAPSNLRYCINAVSLKKMD